MSIRILSIFAFNESFFAGISTTLTNLWLLIGSGIFAEIYPLVKTRILRWGKFSAVTVPELLNLNLWIVIILMEGLMIGFLLLLEYSGL